MHQSGFVLLQSIEHTPEISGDPEQNMYCIFLVTTRRFSYTRKDHTYVDRQQENFQLKKIKNYRGRIIVRDILERKLNCPLVKACCFIHLGK